MTIDYNQLNLPKKFTGAEGTIEITYDAAGRKLQKQVTGEDEYTLNYVSGFEYRNSQLESVYHSEGRVYFAGVEEGFSSSGPRYEFALRDHLGNTRLVFSDLNGDGGIRVSVNPEVNEIIQEHHYYPFGMEFEGPWTVHPARESGYQYNGKELNEDLELDWLDYGARWYDPAIGRFTGVDPISDQFPHVSTYNYAENEPIAGIDLWGLQRVDINTYSDPAVQAYLNKNKRSTLTKGEYSKLTKPSVVAGTGLLAMSPVDETVAAGWLLTKIPGVSKVVNGASKLLGQAFDGLKSLFKSGDNIGDLTSGVSKTIHEGKQGKHISGHNNFEKGKSELTNDAQSLLDDFHGEKVNSIQKINDDKTRVDFGKEIGNYVNPETGEKIPTTVGTVINSKSGAHIVPARPKVDELK